MQIPSVQLTAEQQQLKKMKEMISGANLKLLRTEEYMRKNVHRRSASQFVNSKYRGRLH